MDNISISDLYVGERFRFNDDIWAGVIKIKAQGMLASIEKLDDVYIYFNFDPQPVRWDDKGNPTIVENWRPGSIIGGRVTIGIFKQIATIIEPRKEETK